MFDGEYIVCWLSTSQLMREFQFVPLEGAPGQIIQTFPPDVLNSSIYM